MARQRRAEQDDPLTQLDGTSKSWVLTRMGRGARRGLRTPGTKRAVPDSVAPTKNLFISHISDESEIAQWLKGRLRNDFRGALEVFVSSDRPTIEAGSRWLDEVEQALTVADLQVVLCSPASVVRPWVNFEAGVVWLRRIPVVPVCHSGIGPSSLQAPLSLLQAVAMSDRAGLEKLYDIVAQTLGTPTPPVDFAAVAAEAAAAEAEHERRAVRIETIAEPRVLCAASAQHAQIGFDLDVDILERSFPGRVTVEKALTARRLRQLLTNERFDIVHLVTLVDRARGELVFDGIDSDPADARRDLMGARGLSSLLQRSGARLAVLATCDVGVMVAGQVATVANVAAGEGTLDGDTVAEWADCFYGLLADGTPVHEAFDITADQNEVPIRGLKQTDVIFAAGG